MTMIAFHVTPTAAEIATDTLTYDRNGRTLGRGGKVHLLPHLNAAMLAQGAAGLGPLWAFRMSMFTEDVLDFDGLDELARLELPGTWQRLNTELPGSSDSIVFHIGHSPSRGRFVAYAYPSIDGFRRNDMTEHFYAMPAPLSVDPQAPRNVKEWVALALLMRKERALAPITEPGMKVFIGGDVVMTRLQVGSITQKTIHSFDDTGEEFREMVRGTLHPLGQLGHCPCGSGRMLAVCHPLPPDSPCTCGSGGTFADCCRVDLAVR